MALKNAPKQEMPLGKVSIADEDLEDWENILREGDFTRQEIDAFFTRLNKTHRQDKMSSREKFVDDALEEWNSLAISKRGKGLDDREKKFLRKGIERRYQG